MKSFLSFLLCFALLFGVALPCHGAQSDPVYDMDATTFTASDDTELPYRFHIPSATPPENGFPVLIHLHGLNEGGFDNESQLSVGMELIRSVLSQKSDEAIVIVPQAGTKWVDCQPSVGTYSVDGLPVNPYLSAVMELLEQFKKDHAIDETRIYVSGISMGGYGTWDLLARYPNTFAAAIPVCGGGDPTKAHLMTAVAIRTFHSADDPIVPVSGTRAMVEAVEKAGGNILYQEYTNLSHSCWTTALRSVSVMAWLFRQSRTTKTPEPNPGVPDYSLGDVDQNGVVAAADALEVLKSVVGKVTLTQSQTLAADADQNGTVTAADALMILQVVVGKIPPFNP